jgi:hypothetical protein
VLLAGAGARCGRRPQGAHTRASVPSACLDVAAGGDGVCLCVFKRRFRAAFGIR